MSTANSLGATIEQAQDQLSNRPLRASSAGRSWIGIGVEECAGYHVEELFAPARDHAVITLCLADSPFVVQERCGKRYSGPARAGEATIMPAGCETRWRGLLPAHICMRLAPEALETAAQELGGARRGMEIINNFHAIDPALQHFGALYRLELSRAAHPAQALIMETLSTALSAHVLRQYAQLPPPNDDLPQPNMAALRRVLDYIEDNCHQPVRLVELANLSGYSRFHFSRVFKDHIGLSPMQYVERSRIERAKAFIRSAQLPIAEIALMVGFADQSHFTRRFRHHVGCTPAIYAREHAKGRLPSPLH